MRGLLHGLRLLASLLLLALPFALVGWAWVCLRRMGPCALIGVLLVFVWDAAIVLEPPSLRHTAAGLLFGALAGLLLALVELIGPAFSSSTAPGTSHGSAAWASRRALRQGLIAAEAEAQTRIMGSVLGPTAAAATATRSRR